MILDARHTCRTCGHLCDDHVGHGRTPRPCRENGCTCGSYVRAPLPTCIGCGHVVSLHSGDPQRATRCRAMGCGCTEWHKRRATRTVVTVTVTVALDIAPAH